MKRNTLVLPSDKLLLALSGGADSVALLLLLLDQGIKPVAAHCNFHLRAEESLRDENFVRDLCKKLDVELFVKDFFVLDEIEVTKESIEMAARRMRYDWFEELRQQKSLDFICTAHHKDDQIETVLLNLIRGSGLSGLRGMRTVQGRILRPLLNVYSKEDLRQFLKEQDQEWVEDSTNVDTHYQRNRIRHELIPLLKSINNQADNHILNSARYLQEAEKLIETTQEDWDKEHCIFLPDGVSIPFSTSTRVGAELTPLCSIEEQGDKSSRLLVNRTARGIEIRFCPPKISPTPISKTYTNSLEHLRDSNYALLDASKVVGDLYVRSLETGDRFQPYGMKGSKLVSDYLTDKHRSRIDKLAQLVVCDDLGIVWLCGETISQRVAVNQDSKEIIEISRKDLPNS